MPRTITTTLNVVASNYCAFTPEDYATKDGHTLGQGLAYWPTSYSIDNGFSKVGTAEVTITLHDPDDLIANKVEALRAEKQQTLADAQAKATRLESQIQQLLAITNGVPA